MLNSVAKRTPSEKTAEISRRFGEFVRKERLRLELSQEKLAELSGLSTNHIQNLENNRNNSSEGGTANPTLDTIFAIESALGLELGESLVKVRAVK